MTSTFKITRQLLESDDFNKIISAEWERRRAEVMVAEKRARDAVWDAYFAERPQPQRTSGIHIGPRGGKYRVVNGRKCYDVA